MNTLQALALLRRNIERTIGLGTVLAVLIVVLGCVGLQWHARQKTLENAHQTAYSVATALEVQTVAAINSISKTLQLIAADARLHPKKLLAHNASAVALLQQWQRDTEFVRALWVIDAQGNMLHDSDNAPTIPNYSARKYFTEQRDNPDAGLYVGPMIANTQGVWFIPLSRRIHNADGTFAGVVVAALEPKAFEAMYARVSLGEGSALGLVSRDSKLIARVPVRDQLRGQQILSLAKVLSPLQQQAQGSFRFKSEVDGIARLFAFRQIENRDMVVLVGLGEDVVLHNWNHTNVALGSAALGLSGLLAMMGWLAMREFRQGRRLTRKLQESEALLNTVLEVLPVPVFAKDVQNEFRWTVWNKAAEELFGIKRQDCLGKPDTDFFPKDQIGTFRFSDYQAIESGVLIDIAQESVNLATGPGVVRTRKILVRDRQGQPSFVLGVCQDITQQIQRDTERQAAHEALAASDAFARSTLDALDQQVCVLDKEGRIVAVNQSWRDFGIVNGAVTDSLGANYLDVCSSAKGPDSAEATTIAQGLMSVMRHERDSFALEYPCDSPTEQRWFACRVLRFQGDSGNILVMHDNITKFKRSQQALMSANLAIAQSRKFLQSITDQVPSMIGYWDSNLLNRFSNAAYQEWFGRSGQDLEGVFIGDMMGPELFALNEPLMRAALAGQRQRFDRSLKMNDGRIREVITDYIPDVDEMGTVVGFIVLVTDVTDLTSVQDALSASNVELQRSNSDLEQFAYAASHDLIEPLRSVSSSVQLLQKRYAGQLDARADEFIAHAVSGAQRMQILIHDLLAFSRISTVGDTRKAVSLQDALDTACANLESALAESRAELTHDVLPVVFANVSQLAQLLQNLIGNALKFRGDLPARIHVGAKQVEGEWVLSVEDQGIGIDSKYFGRIFDLFKRLHTREEYPGTGIGLALCKKIVERHGGRMWVESELGQGATFYFTLPVDLDI